MSHTPSRPKIWTFNDPFINGKSTGNIIKEAATGEASSWKTVVDERREVQNERCETWRAEIENLLVFAGLFSAIVTTFVVDSYKNIEPDPQDTTVLLLARLVSRLAPGDDDSISTAPIPSPSPNGSQVRVNTLWFLSLVLALGTAAGGITVLQWIRSFKQYDPNLTSKQAFALASLRDQSLEDWNVAAFIATLPFLLQLALVLFLIGLSDFLFNTVSHTVAIPSIAVSAIIVTFLVISIMLPATQYFILRIGMFRKNIPTPCPYRSPPGWAFLWLTQWIGTISGLRQIIHRLLTSQKGARKGNSQSRQVERFLSFKPDSQPGRNDAEAGASTLEWIRTDTHWLLARTRSHACGSLPSPHPDRDAADENPSNQFEPEHDDYNAEYDAANGLSSMQDYTFRRSATPYVLYSCLRNLPPHLVKDTTLWSGGLNDVTGDPAVKIETLYDDFGGELGALSEAEDDMVFLEWLDQTKKMQLGQGITERQLEICVRFLGTIFQMPPVPPRLKPGLSGDTTNKWLWLPSAFKANRLTELASFHLGGAIQEQLLLIFERFITSSRTNHPLVPIDIFHTSGQIDCFVSTVTKCILMTIVFHPDSGNTPIPVHEDSVTKTLGTQINEHLKDFLTQDFLPQNSGAESFLMLFHATCVYVRGLVSFFLNLDLPREKVCARAPTFGKSFIDLGNTWLDVAEEKGLARLDNLNFYQFTFSQRAEQMRTWLGDARPGNTGEVGPGSEGAPEDHPKPKPQKPERRPTLIEKILGRKDDAEAGHAGGSSAVDTALTSPV